MSVETKVVDMRSNDGDRGRTYFRSEARVFSQNGEWYFATREDDQGPFARQDIAQREASRYTAECVSWGAYQRARGCQAGAPSERLVTPRNVQYASRFRSWGRIAFKLS